MNQTVELTPNHLNCAIMKSGGRLEIQAPPVTLMSPPFRIEYMPSETTIDGMRP